jgi:hypothetical protein
MTPYQYEHMIIRQLAGHWLSDEMDDYEEKLDTLAKEFEEDPDGENVIGDRETIESMVKRYLSAQFDTH